ncbi:hypothetical protein [Laspinema olomoucense]|uniref:hypothetical protein n=1 Tax=Laspinema olomoucense TaxID=3231600 RepID=UPI0021BA66FB|nr:MULTISPECIES: hypothetical protein [unclassified Laspinema]MCT7974495.1 hypothetical protein [Laspinema sp. D3d]MCT7989619.1 hypothetical protein [Laspinema sp. D3a]
MIRRFIAALLVLTVTFLGFIQPSYAAPFYPNPGNSIIVPDNSELHYSGASVASDLVANCWNNTPANAPEEVICRIGKDTIVWVGGTLATAGIGIGACYAIDAGIAVVFPPAALLAPLCNTVGVGAAGLSLARKGLPVLAH